MAFTESIEKVLAHEGGYVNDPLDAGGETNYGISKRTYPHLDIAGLTKEQAARIYERDWWERYGYGRIADAAVATKIFDMAVNMGSHQAHKLAQRACTDCGMALADDGNLGPLSISAINSVHGPTLLAALRNRCATFYQDLADSKPSNRKFLKGWLKRAYS